ncbi:MAG: flagellar hook protein FlgE [Rhodospirillales bacterium]
MSLFSALTSGVSGLKAQSSAMGAIADNITNVNTVGYKNAEVDFQTLVTRQTTSNFYSAGGVQARTRNSFDVQGLLQSSTSQTDISISGNGFFVVNGTRQPTVGNQYLFTRAGSFARDDEGLLRNTAGFYLQGWPTDAFGNVVLPTVSNASLPNQSVISNDFLETINLGRVTGAAAATSTMTIGANLPASAEIGAAQRLDSFLFDSLGNANAPSFAFTKVAPNQWDVAVAPPSGSSVATLYDSAGNVYQSVGLIELTAIPDAGQSIIVGGVTYTFVNGASPLGDNNVQRDGGRTLSQIVADLRDEINDDLVGTPASISAPDVTALVIAGDAANPDITVDPNGVSSGGVAATRQTSAFTIQSRANTNAGIVFSADGLPATFNVDRLAVLGFTNGAADMNDVDLNGDGRIDVERIAIDFGSIGQANGMTQFGGAFTPTVMRQNGAPFGTLAGISISAEGLMEALFDNGESRPIYRIPVATFVNPNGLGARTGNVWHETVEAGDATLREAGTGPAGEINQSSLEASTVDIAQEFTDMIIVQRAYSAATKIISTADEMLDELIRLRR